MNHRRAFLRNITLAIAASLLPKILQPIASEIEDEIQFVVWERGAFKINADGTKTLGAATSYIERMSKKEYLTIEEKIGIFKNNKPLI